MKGEKNILHTLSLQGNLEWMWDQDNEKPFR